MIKRWQVLVAVVVLPLLTAGCADIKAKMAFKDGNKLYKEENFRKAIEKYAEAVELDPQFSAAWFYLASSNQVLYRPGKDDADNVQYLEKAIEYYGKCVETNSGSSEQEKQVKMNALAALTGIYAEDPRKDFDKAFSYAQQLVQENRTDPKNMYAMANLYEKFGHVEDAEKTYREVADSFPNDPKACAALAGFLNKPLWDDLGTIWVEGSDRPRRSKFDEAITTLVRCADLAPDDASGYQKVATFYWDKGFRDPLLSDGQKRDYADKGLEYVSKALEIKPDYFEAIIYKGLLFRLKAGVTTNPREKAQYLEQAGLLQKQGLEIKKQQAAAAANTSPFGPAPEGSE